jgi:hypothetical protein
MQREKDKTQGRRGAKAQEKLIMKLHAGAQRFALQHLGALAFRA